MRTLMSALALLVVLSVAGAGQEVVLVERIQDLSLSDAQEAKIAEIRKECEPKVQEAAKELAALVKEEEQKLQGVLTAEQKQKIQALKEERKEHRSECVAHAIANLKALDMTDAEMAKIGEISTEFRPKMAKCMKELHGLLSDEQRKARADAVSSGKKRVEVIAALKLTDAQKDKIVAVAKDLTGLVRQEMEQIRDTLTASQKEKLADLKEERKEHARDRMAHRVANLKDLNLTDEQRTRLAAIRNEYRPRIHEAGNRLRGAIRDEVERVAAVLKEQ